MQENDRKMTLEIFNYLPRTEPRNDKYKRKSNSTSSKRWPPSLLQRCLYLDKLSSRCFESLKQRPRRVNQTKGRSTSHFSSPPTPLLYPSDITDGRSLYHLQITPSSNTDTFVFRCPLNCGKNVNIMSWW